MPLSIEDIISSYPISTAEAAHTFYLPKEEIDKYYYIVSGHIGIYWSSFTGPDILIHILGPKSCFPIFCLLSKGKNLFYFNSLSSISYIQIPKNIIEQAFRENSTMYDQYAKKFCSALRLISIRLIESYCGTAFDRIVSSLIYLNKVFQTEIEIAITHKTLASLAGITRETATRELNKLQKMGILKLKYKRINKINLIKLNDLVKNNPLLSELEIF